MYHNWFWKIKFWLMMIYCWPSIDLKLKKYNFVQESARGAVEVARNFFPEVECKWGDAGLDEIIKDSSIIGVAVVLAGQTQVKLFHSPLCSCHYLPE